MSRSRGGLRLTHRRAGRASGAGRAGQAGEKKRVKEVCACGHTEPRTSGSEARYQRQFAPGVGPRRKVKNGDSCDEVHADDERAARDRRLRGGQVAAGGPQGAHRVHEDVRPGSCGDAGELVRREGLAAPDQATLVRAGKNGAPEVTDGAVPGVEGVPRRLLDRRRARARSARTRSRPRRRRRPARAARRSTWRSRCAR